MDSLKYLKLYNLKSALYNMIMNLGAIFLIGNVEFQMCAWPCLFMLSHITPIREWCPYLLVYSVI